MKNKLLIKNSTYFIIFGLVIVLMLGIIVIGILSDESIQEIAKNL